jgi:hypothetical protein
MKDGYKRIVDNKIRGAYGYIDEKNKVIAINKERHYKNVKTPTPIKDRTIINTIVHEENHASHPKMNEKDLREKTRRDVERMSSGEKNKLYKRYK